MDASDPRQMTSGELAEPVEPEPAADLMAALEESVRAARHRGGE